MLAQKVGWFVRKAESRRSLANLGAILKNRTPSRKGTRGGKKEPKGRFPAREAAPEFEAPSGPIIEGYHSGRRALSLWLRPPQSQIDEYFRPYYTRVLSGELEALLEFYELRSHQLSPAFFECVGLLATSPYAYEREIVESILGIGSRGGPHQTTPAKWELAHHWMRRLHPPAREAKQWIKQQRRLAGRKGGPNLTREQLWQKYLREKVGQEKLNQIPGLLTEFGVDWAAASEQEPRRHFRQLRHPYRKMAIASRRRKLLAPDAWPSAREERMITKGMTAKELREKRRSIGRFICQTYLSLGVIPRSLFFELTQSQPNVPPSFAVRRLAAKLAGISESALSRRLDSRR